MKMEKWPKLVELFCVNTTACESDADSDQAICF